MYYTKISFYSVNILKLIHLIVSHGLMVKDGAGVPGSFIFSHSATAPGNSRS